MAYVIAEPCIATCDQACLDVCPTDCIHGPVPREEIEAMKDERPRRLVHVQLYVDPASCIDCGACAPECPVSAIFQEEELPPKWSHYRDLNAQFFQSERSHEDNDAGPSRNR
jgi:NAD-dependent dihydropyrimidine dehydrogenase PreA subunit